MLEWQKFIVGVFGAMSLFTSIKCFYECYWNRKSYDYALWILFTGGFVLADGTMFGIFWFLASLILLYLNNWYLVILTFLIFWIVRGIGELMWCCNIQFHRLKRYPPHKFDLYKLLRNDSVFFGYQIFWQSIVTALIAASLYYGKLWLSTI